ncbi:Ldh family oxidoreductase [Marinicrinis sediminis]|uniref:Ldh family oxidoreductase n=1 Tax=Marinicrinis sediminis TaxID=1652465 RepID=A0ABW5R9N0_9BACL
MSNRRYHWKRLEQFVAQVFQRSGLPPEEASVVSESLIEADLRGVDSHGVVRTEIYVQRLEKGMVASGASMQVMQDGGLTLLDAQNSFGAVAGNRALELALTGARQHGLSIVGVKNSNHFGTCAYYLKKAVEQDMLLMVMSNASQTMPPTGGIRPFIGTNPLAVGVPAGRHLPFMMDMATSVVARGKIIVAAEKGEAIPEGWAVDAQGRPTTDAQEALSGSVLPLGGPKGYALSMFIDIMAGVLTGAGFGKSVNNMYENWAQPQNVGHFFIAMDIGRMMPVAQFKQRMDEYIEDLKAEPKAPGVNEILIPGELEFRREQERKQQGIELPLKVQQMLSSLGERHGLSLTDTEIDESAVYE